MRAHQKKESGVGGLDQDIADAVERASSLKTRLSRLAKLLEVPSDLDTILTGQKPLDRELAAALVSVGALIEALKLHESMKESAPATESEKKREHIQNLTDAIKKANHLQVKLLNIQKELAQREDQAKEKLRAYLKEVERLYPKLIDAQTNAENKTHIANYHAEVSTELDRMLKNNSPVAPFKNFQEVCKDWERRIARLNVMVELDQLHKDQLDFYRKNKMKDEEKDFSDAITKFKAAHQYPKAKVLQSFIHHLVTKFETPITQTVTLRLKLEEVNLWQEKTLQECNNFLKRIEKMIHQLGEQDIQKKKMLAFLKDRIESRKREIGRYGSLQSPKSGVASGLVTLNLLKNRQINDQTKISSASVCNDAYKTLETGFIHTQTQYEKDDWVKILRTHTEPEAILVEIEKLQAASSTANISKSLTSSLDAEEVAEVKIAHVVAPKVEQPEPQVVSKDLERSLDSQEAEVKVVRVVVAEPPKPEVARPQNKGRQPSPRDDVEMVSPNQKAFTPK